MPMGNHLQLLDWRRRVDELYGQVRRGLGRDPTGAHRHWREVRDDLFARHPQTPLDDDARRGFDGLPCYPYDPALAFAAELDTDVERERYDIPTSTGRAMTFVRVGVVDLPVGRLDAYWLDAYAGGLFVPFRDATAGDATYGGGRYLLDTAKGADLGQDGAGRLVLDFNFSYHPSCTHDATWDCPLAPPGSRLDVAIEAGERLRGA